ncbi:MAG: pyruvate dehydrogenase (acetyl-transferring) E1 component subunit alpha [Thermoplasmata archaeon]
MAEASPPTVSRPDPGTPSDLSPEDLLRAYRTMLVARTMDERCLTLQRQGRIGFYAPLQGQEAAQVGAAMALDPKDWVFPAYRELGVALVRGIPLKLLLDQFIGNAGDRIKGRQMPNHYGYPEYRFVSISSPVGTQITQAVGAAMAAQRRHDAVVTMTFFGDGTTSSNDFHAGLNFAGVFRAPTIFFCQNNQWAISVPRSRQTHSETLAQKAEAYGFPGVVVDGDDLHAVYRVVSEARRRAMAGEGPTLIEAQVYRLGPHSTSDDPRRYRQEAEVEEWRGRDPIERLKAELVASGALTDEADASLRTAVREEISSALKAAEETPPIDPMTMLDDVLAAPTPNLEDQRNALALLLRDGVVHP